MTRGPFIWLAAFCGLAAATPCAAAQTKTDNAAQSSFALLEQADAAQKRGDLRAAIDLRVRAVEIDKRVLAPSSPAIIDQNAKLAELYLDLRDPYKSEAYIAPAMTHAIEQYGLVDERTQFIASVYVSLLRFQNFQSAAEQMAAQMLAVTNQEFGSVSMPSAIWALTYGNVLNDGGRFEEAATALEQAAATFRSLEQPQGLPFALSPLAFSQLGQGDYEAALVTVEEGRRAAAQANLPRTASVVVNLEIAFARAQIRSGDGDAAVTVLTKLYSLLQSDRNRPPGTLDRVELDLADALISVGRWERATPLYEASLEKISTRLDETDPLLTRYLADYGASLLFTPGRTQEALEPLRKAGDLIEWRREYGGINSYERQINDERRVSEQNLFRDLTAAYWIEEPNRGMTGPASNAAFLALQNSLSGMTDLTVVRSAVRSAAMKANPAIEQLLEERDALNEQVERRRERMARDTSSGIPSSGDAYETTAFGQNWKQMEQLDKIDEKIKALDPNFFKQASAKPITVDEARALLGQDEAALLLVPTWHGTFVSAVTSSGVTWHRSALTDIQVSSMVDSLRASLDQRPDESGGFAVPFDRSVSHDLYSELIAPLESALADKDHLFVAAGGALTSLPFAVLVTEPPSGDDGDAEALRATAWLDESIALVQIPSLQSLQFLRQMARSTKAGSDTRDVSAGMKPFLGYGNPDLEGSFKPGERMGQRAGYGAVAGAPAGPEGTVLADVERLRALPRLPNTQKELDAMARALVPRADRRAAREAGAPVVRMGELASEEAVKAADLSNYKVLAFATHGLLAGEEGAAEPGLVFTPPPAASLQDDGLLTASEITALDLGAEWVILSACNTAAGDAPGAPGLSGLARAFFYAGARSLLASHWPVLDEVAPRISVPTLGASDPSDPSAPVQTRAQAFASAVHTLRNDTDKPTYAHPAAWAPFVLIGDK